MVGEIAVLSSGRRTTSVIATSPLRAIALFKRDVWALEDTAPTVASRLRMALDERRAQDERRVSAAPEPPLDTVQ